MLFVQENFSFHSFIYPCAILELISVYDCGCVFVREVISVCMHIYQSGCEFQCTYIYVYRFECKFVYVGITSNVTLSGCQCLK